MLDRRRRGGTGDLSLERWDVGGGTVEVLNPDFPVECRIDQPNLNRDVPVLVADFPFDDELRTECLRDLPEGRVNIRELQRARVGDDAEGAKTRQLARDA